MVFILQSPQVCTIFSPKIDVKSSHKCKLIKQEVVVFFFLVTEQAGQSTFCGMSSS